MNDFDNLYNEIMNEKNQIDESTVTHLWTIMHGLNRTVKTIGIITAENPMKSKLNADENRRLNNRLKDHFSGGVYGYQQIKGKFGNMEHPFFVQNIHRKDLIELGKRYHQKSVIWGNVSNPYSLVYEYIDCQKGVENSRAVFKKDIDRDDFYSEYRGRKFVIPFFEKDFNDKKFKYDNKGVVIENTVEINQLLNDAEQAAIKSVNDKYQSYYFRIDVYVAKEKLAKLGVDL
jgi:hypothetical protein